MHGDIQPVREILFAIFAGLACFCGTIFLGLLIAPVVGPFFHGIQMWMGHHELQVYGYAFLVSAVICIILFFISDNGDR